MTRQVLVVCTANVCRSPMGEALLRGAASSKNLAVTSTSAGVKVPGLPVDPDAVKTMATYGLDIRDHQPRQATREILRSDGADLIIAMTREHLRELVSIDRSVWPRTFTLPELVRRASAVRPSAATDTWDGWLLAVAEGRTARDLMIVDPSDDIEDPYGMSLAAHRDAASQIAELMGAVTELAPFDRLGDWPPPDPPLADPGSQPFAPPRVRP